MGFPRQEYWSGLPFPSSWSRDRTWISCIAGRFLPSEPLWQKLRVKLRTPHPQLRAYVTQTMRQSLTQERFLTEQRQKARFCVEGSRSWKKFLEERKPELHLMLDRAPACSVIGNLSTVQALMIPTLSQKVSVLSQKPDLRVNSVGHLILREGTVEEEN